MGEETVLEDDFDPGIINSLWSQVSGGTASSVCGSFSGNALYFNGNGNRNAVTNNINVLNGGTVSFAIKIAQGIAPCDNADFGENIVLEYSTNNGGSWTNITTYYEYMFPNFTSMQVVVPAGAQNANTRFRWRQIAHSGVNEDNWALDDIRVSSVSLTGFVYHWAPATALSATNIANPVATPTQDTWYTIQVIDASTTCVYADSVLIEVGQPFSVSVPEDTFLCDAAGIQLFAIPGSGSGHTFSWSPSDYLSDSTISNPWAAPDSSTTYVVTVTSPQSCSAIDSVTILSNGLVDLVVTANDQTLCLGESAQLQATMSGVILSDDFNTGVTNQWF
ncbi:MAG TPA: hypothetical protein EYO59_13255, partial [Chromatiaceae bacterium]|nr:hypothetical protein [Chromatiaceae bacterium]